MENIFIKLLKKLWNGNRSFWIIYHYLFKTPPFRLRKAPQKRWGYNEDKIVIPTAPGQSEKATGTQKKAASQQVFLYPAGLKGWFFAFSFFPALTIACSLENWFHALLTMVSYLTFTAISYFFLYHVFNRPVLSGLWLNWPKSYANLIDDFFPRKHVASTLPHGVRQRQKVAMSLAMREFFPISRFITHWLAPVWLSYFALLIWFCVAYYHFTTFGVSTEFALHPKQLLLPLIVWWLISLLFAHRERRYMANESWVISLTEINKYPPSTKSYIKYKYHKYKKPEITFFNVLAFIQIAAFGIYLTLLIFYVTAWSAESKPQQTAPGYFYAETQKNKH